MPASPPDLRAERLALAETYDVLADAAEAYLTREVEACHKVWALGIAGRIKRIQLDLGHLLDVLDAGTELRDLDG